MLSADGPRVGAADVVLVSWDSDGSLAERVAGASFKWISKSLWVCLLTLLQTICMRCGMAQSHCKCWAYMQPTKCEHHTKPTLALVTACMHMRWVGAEGGAGEETPKVFVHPGGGAQRPEPVSHAWSRAQSEGLMPHILLANRAAEDEGRQSRKHFKPPDNATTEVATRAQW